MTSLIIAALASFAAVYAGAVTLNAPRKFLIPAGIGGVICWVLYYILLPYTNIMANFFAGVAVALYSHVMARIYKTPVTVFFIPGFLPIVPGVTIFKSVHHYITGHNDKFYQYLSETIQIATLIALAIVVTDALFKILLHIKKHTAK